MLPELPSKDKFASITEQYAPKYRKTKKEQVNMQI